MLPLVVIIIPVVVLLTNHSREALLVLGKRLQKSGKRLRISRTRVKSAIPKTEKETINVYAEEQWSGQTVSIGHEKRIFQAR